MGIRSHIIYFTALVSSGSVLIILEPILVQQQLSLTVSDWAAVTFKADNLGFLFLTKLFLSPFIWTTKCDVMTVCLTVCSIIPFKRLWLWSDNMSFELVCVKHTPALCLGWLWLRPPRARNPQLLPTIRPAHCVVTRCHHEWQKPCVLYKMQPFTICSHLSEPAGDCTETWNAC